jgi:two-component system LytT family response regulator
MITDFLPPEEIAERKSFLIISNNKTRHILPFENIIRLEACGVYTIVYLVNGKQPVYSKNIGKVFSELNPEIFFRVHKSHIINMRQVKSCVMKKRFGHILMMDDKLIKVAYRHKSVFCENYEKFCLRHSA